MLKFNADVLCGVNEIIFQSLLTRCAVLRADELVEPFHAVTHAVHARVHGRCARLKEVRHFLGVTRSPAAQAAPCSQPTRRLTGGHGREPRTA